MFLNALYNRFRRIFADDREKIEDALAWHSIAGDVRAEKEGWDIFVSYAHEDRAYVHQLISELRLRGISVWYDEFEMEPLQTIREAIDRGISGSRYAAVVLSPNYLEKDWTIRELDAFLSKETATQKAIIPIWHQLDHNLVARFSPIMASRFALSSELQASEIAGRLYNIVDPPRLMHMEVYDGKTIVIVADKIGVVIVQNYPAGSGEPPPFKAGMEISRFHNAKFYDFGGKEIQFHKELFGKKTGGPFFVFDDTVGIARFNRALCTNSQIATGRAMYKLNEESCSLPFGLLHVVGDYFTLGFTNEEVWDAWRALAKNKQ